MNEHIICSILHCTVFYFGTSHIWRPYRSHIRKFKRKFKKFNELWYDIISFWPQLYATQRAWDPFYWLIFIIILIRRKFDLIFSSNCIATKFCTCDDSTAAKFKTFEIWMWVKWNFHWIHCCQPWEAVNKLIWLDGLSLVWYPSNIIIIFKSLI